jgi:RNA polymerase sigma-32 factor
LRADGEGASEWQDWMVDEEESQEARLVEAEELDNRRRMLTEALKVLNDREKRIFTARRLSEEPLTLEQLSEEFGVSRERVRQIEVRAFEKVQKAVTDSAKKLESAGSAA